MSVAATSRPRDIRAMLTNIAARLRSSHAGERRNARDLIVRICARERIDPREYGVEPDPASEDEQYGADHRWRRARILDECAAGLERAGCPDLARLERFEAERYRAQVRGRTNRHPWGDAGGCAVMITGFEDIEHWRYCHSPVCPEAAHA